MRHYGVRLVPLAVVLALVACSQPEPTDATLRDSFAQQIAATSLVTDFMRDGDELSFSGPDGNGNISAWRVRFDTSLVEEVMFDDQMPYRGRITSEWHRDGELVEYLGSMTALPKEFLDRGLGQECWANWVDAERRWSWT